MKTITLIRHAQSMANAGSVSYPNAEIPLSDLGHRQAVALSKLLERPKTIVSSTFERARDTSAYTAAHFEMPASIDALAHEHTPVGYDIVAGMTGEGRRPIREEYWGKCDPHLKFGNDAETFENFINRVRAFSSRLDQFEDGTVVFSHGMFIAAVIWMQMGFAVETSLDMRRFRKFQIHLPMPNCAVYRFHQSRAGWQAVFDEQIASKIYCIK